MDSIAKVRQNARLGILTLALLASALAAWMSFDESDAHGTCKTHHQYRVYDGTHDGDGDGVGCESLPAPPTGQRPTSSSSSFTSRASTYDRDNWSYHSGSARAALGCSSSEHVDHIVALKEAYDSGAEGWLNSRKATFANDRANLWCLDAGLNISKSDHDLAEWRGGTCSQRQHIATVTVTIKAKYDLAIDNAEQRAIDTALAARCGGAQTSRTASVQSSQPQSGSTDQTENRTAAESRVQIGVDGLLKVNLDDFTTWISRNPMQLSALFRQLSGFGVSAIHLWNSTDKVWQSYAVADDETVPGSVDVEIGFGDILWLSG